MTKKEITCLTTSTFEINKNTTFRNNEKDCFSDCKDFLQLGWSDRDALKSLLKSGNSVHLHLYRQGAPAKVHLHLVHLPELSSKELDPLLHTTTSYFLPRLNAELPLQVVI